MRYGSATDAPTYLGSKDLGLPPEWLPEDNEIVTSAPRAAAPRAAALHSPPTHLRQPTERSRSGYVPPRIPTERSESPISVPSVARPVVARRTPAPQEVRKREKSVAAPAPAREKSVAAPAPAREKSVAAPAPAPAPAPAREKSVAAQKSVTPGAQKSMTPAAQKSRSAAPTPQAPATQRPPTQPQMPAGINAIDPLAVPVPPELGATIYGWIRRLALQADLAGADRVLRDALLDITSSLSVSIVYPGADGLWSLGADEEIPRDSQPLIAVAMARRAVVSSHSAIIPIVTSSETVGVVTLTRNPRNPAYHPIEQIAMIALVREAAAILHHLAVTHLQRAAEINADKGGLYRGEALEAHRSRGNEGVPIHLTPGWVRRTYPMLLIAVIVAIVVSIFITVPTYSSGQGMVMLKGTSVTAPAMGTVDQIYVQQGDFVKKGQVLCRLHSATEEAELAHAHTEFQNAKINFLQEQSDDTARKTVASASARVERAQAAVDARVLRARKDGIVSDRRIQQGQALNVGDHILMLVDANTEPEIIAFLPGTDRPRLKLGQKLQIGLTGYKKTRELAEITAIGNEIIGLNEIARIVGPQQADQFKQLQGTSFVIVHARLPNRTFQTEHRTYHFFHGLHATTEVKVQSKPFLVSLLPALEKYFPD